MISFGEEHEGGDNNINDRTKDPMDFSDADKKALGLFLQKHLEKEQVKAEQIEAERTALNEKYQFCTPIYKFMSIRIEDEDPIAQIKFLYGYEENDVIREDVIQRASDALQNKSIEHCEENGIKGHTTFFYSIDDKSHLTAPMIEI